MRNFNLFLEKQVQKKTRKDEAFATLPGLHKAIRLPSEILSQILLFERNVIDKNSYSRAKAIGGSAWRFFYPFEEKCMRLELAIKEAYRIEGVISFLKHFEKMIFELGVKFYRKNEKKFFFSVWFYIDKDTAKIIDGGYSGSPTLPTLHKKISN